MNEDNDKYAKVYYIADEEITVFFGLSNISNGELNEKVNTMYVNPSVEDMVFRVQYEDNVADILAYQN